MRVVILPTEKEASDFAADFIEKFITEKNDSVTIATHLDIQLDHIVACLRRQPDRREGAFV